MANETIETAVYRLQTEGVEQLVQMGKAVDQTAASEERLAQSTEKVTRATRTSVDGVERMIAGLDKRTRSMQQLLNGLERLQRYEDEGISTATRRAQAETLLNQRFDEQAAAIDRVGARVQQLTAKFDAPTASARRMAMELADLNEAQRLGVNIAGGYTAAFERIVESYDDGAQAAKRFAAAQAEVIDQARSVQNAANAQQFFNERTGVARPPGAGAYPGGSAGGAPTATTSAFADLAELEALVEKNAAAAAQRIQLLTDKFDPATASARRMNVELGDLNDAQRLGVNIAGGYEAALDRIVASYNEGTDAATRNAEAQRRAAEQQRQMIDQARADQHTINAQQAINESLGRPATSGRNQGATVNLAPAVGSAQASAAVFEAAANEEERLARATRDLEEAINPLVKAQRLLDAEIANADELLKAKLITDEKHSAALRLAQGNFENFGKSARGGASEADLAAQANRRMSATVLNLSFQLNDVVSGLISGQAPLRIMAQQGGQIVQAFQQSPVGAAGVMAAFVTYLKSFITPSVAAAAATGALAAGFIVLMKRASDLEAEARKLNVTLDAMGTRGMAVGTNFLGVIRDLEAMGVKAEDARKALADLSRTPGINPAQSQQIIGTAANISAVRGTDVVSENKELTSALKEGADATIEYGAATHTLTGEQARMLRSMKDLQGDSRATNEAFRLISETSKGWLQGTLSPMEKVMDRLSASIKRMLDALVLSGPVKASLDALQHFFDTMTAMSEGKPLFLNLGPFGQIDLNAAAAAQRAAATRLSAANAPRRPGDLAFDNDFAVTHGGASPVPSSALPSDLLRHEYQPPFTPKASAGAVTGIPTTEDLDKLDKMERANQKIRAALRLIGEAAIYAQAYQEAFAASTLSGDAKIYEAELKAEDAIKRHRIELEKSNETQRITNDLALKTAAAYGTSMAGGLRAAAEAQAILDVRAGNARNVQQRTIDLLRTAAAESAKSLGEQEAAGVNAIAAQERLATATEKGTSAAKEQEIQNEAIAKTETMLAQATALHDENLRKLALAYKDLFEAQGRAKEAATQTAAAFAEVNRMGRDLQVAQLETAMIGKAPEDVTRAISLLQGAQRIADQFGLATSKAKDDYAEMVANLANAQVHLAKLREEQERSTRLFQGVAGVIENTLGTAIDDIFAGKKIDDWGARLKTMFGQVQATIAKETFLKPLIGTAVQLAGGSPDVVKQYGSFLGNETKDATGEMVKKWADQLATTPLAVKTMTVEQATINVANAAAAVGATAAPGGPMAPVSSSVLTGPLTGSATDAASPAPIVTGNNQGWPFPIVGTSSTFPALPANTTNWKEASGPGFPSNPTPLGLPANASVAPGANAAVLDELNRSAEKAALSQDKLTEATTRSASAADQAAQANQQQANDNAKLTEAATGSSTATAGAATAIQDWGGSAEKLTASADTAKSSIGALGDSTKVVTDDFDLAAAKVTDLATGTSALTANLDSQKTATDSAGMSAQQAGDFARSFSTSLDAAGASASTAAPNIQALAGTLDALDEKVLQSAVGVQQASGQIANAAATTAAAGSAAGSSVGSLSSLGGTISSALRPSTGGFSLNNLGQIGGLFDKIGGLFGGSGSSSGGIFGNLLKGPSLFSSGGLFSSQGALFGTAADLSIAAGGPPLALGAGGEGLLAAGGAGLEGIGGFSSILSGIGGALPVVGLLGTAIPLLMNLFGNKKPSNASAGGNIDFTTGQVTGTFSGGNSQIDQSTAAAVKEIGSFTQNLLKLSGGSLAGNVLLQNGVNTGFTADSSVPGYTGRFNLGKDAAQAVQVVELALARTLTGVSDTMKTVINSVTDPAQLQDAIAFAGVYDKLKEAFDSSFASINQDTKLVGPFGQALDNLNATFEDLTQKAGQYGLALEPVTAGLAEAVKRLKVDFQTALSQQESQLVGGTDFLGAALQAHQQQVANWSDAVRLGFSDSATQLRVHSIEVAQLGAAFSNLSLDQLVKAVQTFAESAPEVASFAKGLLEAGQYVRDPIDQLILEITDPIEAAIEKERQAGEERVRIAEATGQDIVKVNQYNQMLLSQIWDQATASLVQLRTDLTTGASSGLTAADQVKAANDNFSRELALVEGGNLNEIANLSTAGSNAIQLSQQAYGNAPQTADLRNTIVAAIDKVLAEQSKFTSATQTQQQALTPQIQALIDAATAMTDASTATVSAATTVSTAAATVADAAAQVADAATSVDSSGTSTATTTSLNTINQTNVDLAGVAAAGMTSTPPGTILVGEQGPELISQSGGLRIWSNQETQRILAGMPDRHFAEGTANLGLPPRAPSNDDLRAAIASLSAEVKMLRQQSVRIQQVVGDETTKRLDRIAGGVEQGNRPAFEPPARRRA